MNLCQGLDRNDKISHASLVNFIVSTLVSQLKASFFTQSVGSRTNANMLSTAASYHVSTAKDEEQTTSKCNELRENVQVRPHPNMVAATIEFPCDVSRGRNAEMSSDPLDHKLYAY